MTVTTTDFEVFVEAHPVDAIPCDWTDTMGDCGEAKRSVNMVPCCEGDPDHALICERCRDFLFAPDAALVCTKCRAVAEVQDVLISIERLGRK